MKRVLVTGAGGQLGSELREQAGGPFEFFFYDRAALPLDEPDKLHEAFESVRPHICINAAAYTAVDKAESEREQAFAINMTAVRDLAALCKLHNALLVHVSTDYVFNGTGREPYKEDDPVDPLGWYGASKLGGERVAFETYDNVIIIRTSWVYSYYGKNFIKTMMRLLREKESIGVVADQVGRPTYAADLASAILRIISLNAPAPGIYHYADAGVISWFDLASAVRDEIGAACNVRPITTAEYPTPAKRPAYSVLDTSKIETTFGLTPPDWRESLRRCLAKF